MATKSKEITYKIDSKLLDSLYLVRTKLKRSKQYGSKVMGLCLLGEKDGMVDSFVPMVASDGCWDSPEISYDMFDTHFRKLIEKDRVCVGMAMIRPDNYPEEISKDMRSQIHGWRKAFKDIEKTIWISVSQHNIIAYKPTKDNSNRINTKVYPLKKISKDPESSKILKIAEVRQIVKKLPIEVRRDIEQSTEKIEKDVGSKSHDPKIIERLKALKVEANNLKKRERVLAKKREEEAKRRAQEASERAQENLAKAQARKQREEAAKKHIKDIGNGLILIKDGHGREILWQK